MATASNINSIYTRLYGHLTFEQSTLFWLPQIMMMMMMIK